MHESSESFNLGADHLTLGGGGGGWGWVVISGKQYFFPSNLVGRIFFLLLNALQDIFSPPHFSAGFFFPQKRVMCLHIQNVLTFKK